MPQMVAEPSESGQARHVVAPERGHAMERGSQASHRAAPGEEEAVPTGQEEQDKLPGVLAKVPAAHSVHCAKPVALDKVPNEPAGQGRHEAMLAAPERPYVPSGQTCEQ